MKLFSRSVAGVIVLGLAALTLRSAMAEEKQVKVGDKAPALSSVDENGKPWKSADVVGKKVLVLYFYPADFTGGCTKQACGFRDNIEKLHSQGVEVVGVSGDSVKTHHMFKEHEKLTLPSWLMRRESWPRPLASRWVKAAHRRPSMLPAARSPWLEASRSMLHRRDR